MSSIYGSQSVIEWMDECSCECCVYNVFLLPCFFSPCFLAFAPAIPSAENTATWQMVLTLHNLVPTLLNSWSIIGSSPQKWLSPYSCLYSVLSYGTHTFPILISTITTSLVVHTAVFSVDPKLMKAELKCIHLSSRTLIIVLRTWQNF